MRKLLLPLLWALALVALPVYILLTGNAAAEPVLKCAVYAYASLAGAYAAITGFTALSAAKLWGADLGATAHKRLIKSYDRLDDMSVARFILTPMIGLISQTVISLIGMSTLSYLITAAVTLVLIARLIALQYGKKYKIVDTMRQGVGAGWPAS